MNFIKTRPCLLHLGKNTWDQIISFFEGRGSIQVNMNDNTKQSLKLKTKTGFIIVILYRLRPRRYLQRNGCQRLKE